MTQNESIFTQAIADVSLISELACNHFLQSDFYNGICWSDSKTNADKIKTILNLSGICNPAMMQMCLYALLVMPKELLKKEDSCEERFNKESRKMAIPLSYESNYPDEESIERCNLYRHLRNAVAHSRCEYSIENRMCYVTFIDKDDHKGYHFHAKFLTEDIGKLMDILRQEMMIRLNSGRV